MTARSRLTRFAFCLFPFAFFLLLAAAPPREDSPEELIRRANELFPADAEAADKLYAAAEERTGDPGLVAFNRAAVLFQAGNFREAERHYDRVLDDAACPPDRAAKAWYNRGTCLLRRGGSLSVYRSAIACFENTLESAAADDQLKAKARHNLEIAKLLWIEKAKEEKKKDPPSPNDNVPPEEHKQPRPEPKQSDGGLEPKDGKDGSGKTPKVGPQPGPPKGTTGDPAQQNVAGNNPNLEIPKDTDEVQSLSPEEAREYLKKTGKRRQRELHSLLESLYGPDRVDVRDW